VTREGEEDEDKYEYELHRMIEERKRKKKEKELPKIERGIPTAGLHVEIWSVARPIRAPSGYLGLVWPMGL
jgi:hypothetical protein